MTTSRGSALVTGAASGMGQLAAWRLAAAGVPVAALDVDQAGLEHTARHAPQVTPVVCDVRDVEGLVAAIEGFEADAGPLVRVVDAAAVLPSGLAVDQRFDDLRRAVEINILGVMNVTRATLPGMVARGRGALVQFGSLAGWVPSQRLSLYSATKAAVISYSEALWHETRGSGVQVVCVCPPVVDTPMLDQLGADRPRSLASQPSIDPEIVLDSIEVALERGELFAFPGRGTRTVWRVRRLLPDVLWRRIDALERGGG